MGYLSTRGGETHPAPLDPVGLMDAATELGLSGVEFPLGALVPSFDGALVPVGPSEFDAEAELRKRDLRFVADYGALLGNDATHLIGYLARAAVAGARVVRVTLSGILCGDRRKLAGGWDAHFDALVERLRRVLPHAEALGVCLAVENHQDASSDDLLRMADAVANSAAFGVTLDTGNPLALAEGPVEFTRRIAHLVRHLHVKDYTVHFAPEGYRLVRCAAGEGAMDFPAILAIVGANGHDVLPALETAAQATRTVPMLEDSWWACYPPEQRRHLVEALRVVWAHGRPKAEPYSSAWERGAGSEEVAREEWTLVRRSADYVRTLVGSSPATSISTDVS
jgi:sugar phosphate isomerase/epimerase